MKRRCIESSSNTLKFTLRGNTTAKKEPQRKKMGPLLPVLVRVDQTK